MPFFPRHNTFRSRGLFPLGTLQFFMLLSYSIRDSYQGESYLQLWLYMYWHVASSSCGGRWAPPTITAQQSLQSQNKVDVC